MALTAEYIFQTAVNYDHDSDGGDVFTNPGNATADDANNFTSHNFGGPASPSTRQFLKCTNAGITSGDLPDGSTINDIIIKIGDALVSAGALSYSEVRLQLVDEGGALVGSNIATGSRIIVNSGTPSDKSVSEDPATWGWGSVTAAKLRDSDFGVVLLLEPGAFGMGTQTWAGNYVSVQIDYTPPTGDVTVTPGVIGSCSGAMVAPSLIVGSTIAAALMTGTGQVHDPVVSAGLTVASPAMTGNVEDHTPTISTNGGVDIPAPIIGTSNGAAPSPVVKTGSTLAPAAMTGSAQIESPTISAGVTHSADSVGASSGTMEEPGVITNGNTTITPNPLTGSGTMPAPTVALSSIIQPSAMGGNSGTMPAHTVIAVFNTTVTPSALTGQAGMPVHVASASANVFAAPNQGSASMPLHGVSTGVLVAPGVWTGSAAQNAPTVITNDGALISPATFTGSAAMPSPSVAISGGVVAGVMSGSAVLIAPSVSAGVTHAAGVSTASGSMFSPNYVGPDITADYWWFRQFIIRNRR